MQKLKRRLHHSKLPEAVGKPKRFLELEGLRVIAAVIVVLFHSALIFYPGFFYGVGSKIAPVQNISLENSLYQNPIASLISGTFAVGIFFVLSGFVLSVGFFKKNDASTIRRLASKRYLRLMLPALASTLIAFCIALLFGTESMREVSDIIHTTWLDHFWMLPPDFFDALYKGLLGIFSSPVTVQYNPASYNPVLWTIYYEAIGSFIIFASLLLFAQSRYRLFLYIGLIVYFMNSWLLGFVLGMLLADLYINRTIWFEKINNKYGYIVLGFAIFLGGYPSGDVSSPLYKFLYIPFLDKFQQVSFYICLGAFLCVTCVLAIDRVRSFLAHRFISRFGKYTYSLYLVHMPVLFSVCTSVFLAIMPIGLHKASLLAIILSLILIVVLTYIFEKFIDRPSIQFASYCTDLYFGKKRFDLKKLTGRQDGSISQLGSLLSEHKMTDTLTRPEGE